METTFMNTGNRKTSEPHKFVLNLSQRLDLRSSNKHVALQNFSIYYTWKNIREQYKNNRLKKIASTWDGEFELLDDSYSVSFIQYFFEYTLKNDETLPTNLPIDIYIGRIKNRLVLKIKYIYKLELQTPETMKLFGSITKLTDKTKNGENIPNFELVEVVLA